MTTTSSALVTLDEATIGDYLATSPLPVVVDFWAGWCGPCRLMAPALEHIAATYPDQVRVAKVDVEANEAACERFSVQSLPTLIIFRGAQEEARIVGLRSRPQLLADLATWLEP